MSVIVELSQHIVPELRCRPGTPTPRGEQPAHTLVNAYSIGGCGRTWREGFIIEESQHSLLRKKHLDNLLSFLLSQRFIFKVPVAPLRFVVIQVLLFVIGLCTLFRNFILYIINTSPKNFFEGSFNLDFFGTDSPDSSECSFFLSQESLQTDYDFFITLYLWVLLSGYSSCPCSIEVSVSYKVETISGCGRSWVIKVDGVSCGLGPETSRGGASCHLLVVHLLYISSGLTYSSLRMISSLRRQLVGSSRISHVHRLEPI